MKSQEIKKQKQKQKQKKKIKGKRSEIEKAANGLGKLMEKAECTKK